MNLRERMLQEYAIRTNEQIQADIAEFMEDPSKPNARYYDKRIISDESIEYFRSEGFKVEPYGDRHSDAAGLELIEFSWEE